MGAPFTPLNTIEFYNCPSGFRGAVNLVPHDAVRGEFLCPVLQSLEIMDAYIKAVDYLYTNIKAVVGLYK